MPGSGHRLPLHPLSTSLAATLLQLTSPWLLGWPRCDCWPGPSPTARLLACCCSQELETAAQKLSVCLGESNYFGAIFTIKQLVQQDKADGA